MSIPYDVFTAAFLAKIAEYKLLRMEGEDRQETVDGYMKRAVYAFSPVCVYRLTENADDMAREYHVDAAAGDIDELADIISEGMVVQWLKPYVYQQELLQNVMNTRDYTQYSPSELLHRVSEAYAKAQRDYTQLVREYSYNHGDLTGLHL